MSCWGHRSVQYDPDAGAPWGDGQWFKSKASDHPNSGTCIRANMFRDNNPSLKYGRIYQAGAPSRNPEAYMANTVHSFPGSVPPMSVSQPTRSLLFYTIIYTYEYAIHSDTLPFSIPDIKRMDKFRLLSYPATQLPSYSLRVRHPQGVYAERLSPTW